MYSVRNASTEACGVVCGDMDARTNMFRRRVLMARDRLVRSGKFKLRGRSSMLCRSSISMRDSRIVQGSVA